MLQMITNYSTLQYSIINLCKDHINQVKDNNNVTDNFSFNSFGVSAKGSVIELLKSNEEFAKPDLSDYASVSTIIDNVVVTEVQDIKFKDVLEYLKGLESEDAFYGILVEIDNDSDYLNICHPLVAKAMIKANKVSLDTKVNCYIYTIKDMSIVGVEECNGSIENIKTIMNLEDSEVSVNVDIGYLMSFDETYEIMSLHREISQLEVKLDIPEDTDFYIPVQRAVRNVVVPYYGVEKLRIEDNKVKATSLSCMSSSNVAKDLAGNKVDTKICTGGYANLSEKGLLSLNVSNESSPLDSNPMNGSKWFITSKVYIALATEVWENLN